MQCNTKINNFLYRRHASWIKRDASADYLPRFCQFRLFYWLYRYAEITHMPKYSEIFTV